MKLNGSKELLKFRGENVELQVARALQAFDQNAFVLLVNDSQIETLDETVHISGDTVVTFLRLTPLVGG